MKLGVLVSGRGSNLEAVLEAVADGRLAAIDPVIVISNRPGVRALEIAARHGIPSSVLARRAFVDAGARDRAIGEVLAEASVQLVLLVGYDQLLRPPYFEAYRGQTINIHPSLLPRHGGAGMMGDAVHRSVLAAGDAESGATVHEVTRELDAGAVLAQARVPVLAGDDAVALAARVLEVEHRLVVETLRALAARGADRPQAGHLLG
ncbi:MAG: phosphoribosylglycinamide formyltransferase [Chloroflexota bacterium]